MMKFRSRAGLLTLPALIFAQAPLLFVHIAMPPTARRSPVQLKTPN
jgi:hypothetical protein